MRLQAFGCTADKATSLVRTTSLSPSRHPVRPEAHHFPGSAEVVAGPGHSSTETGRRRAACGDKFSVQGRTGGHAGLSATNKSMRLADDSIWRLSVTAEDGGCVNSHLDMENADRLEGGYFRSGLHAYCARSPTLARSLSRGPSDV